VKEQEPDSSKKCSVSRAGSAIVLLVIAAVGIGAVLAWCNDSVRARYYVWQVCRGKEPGPSMSKLREIGSAVNPYIGKKLPQADTTATKNLLTVLWQVGGDDASDIAATCLDDPDPGVRMAAVRVFHEWGKGKPGAVPLIYKKIDDPSELVRKVACGTLAAVTGVDLDPEVKIWRNYFKNHPELLKPPEDSSEKPAPPAGQERKMPKK